MAGPAIQLHAPDPGVLWARREDVTIAQGGHSRGIPPTLWQAKILQLDQAMVRAKGKPQEAMAIMVSDEEPATTVHGDACRIDKRSCQVRPGDRTEALATEAKPLNPTVASIRNEDHAVRPKNEIVRAPQ